MKNPTLTALGITFFLILVSLAGAAQAGGVIVADISFDDFCDGFHLEVDTATGVVTGSWIGGCIPEVELGGTFGTINGNGRGVTVTYDQFGVGYAVVRRNRTFTLYDINGNPGTSGTWSPGAPRAATGRSVLDGLPVEDDDVFPQRAFLTGNIQFDGFCDGMYIQVDTVTGQVNGFFTGCTNAQHAGTFGDIATQGMGLTVANGGFFLGYTVIRLDRTWTHYFWSGTVLNSGTWSPGIPPAALEGRSSFDVSPD